MAILCLATDIEDLKRRLANIVIGYRYDRTPVSVGDLQLKCLSFDFEGCY